MSNHVAPVPKVLISNAVIPATVQDRMQNP